MAVELATAYVSIVPSLKGAKRKIEEELGGAGKGADGAGAKIGNRLSGGIKKTLKMGVVGAGAAAGTLLGAAITKGMGRLMAIEDATKKLEGLGHSAESVDQIMDDALASVKGTAFGLGDAATVAASTVAAGIKPGQELERVLKLTGDAATIAGSSMGDMGAIFNKVAAANKIQGREIAQLNQAGIPIIDLLSKKLGKSAEETYKLASAGKINFEMFADAMEDGLGGAALKSGETLRGAIANAGAALGRFGAGLMSGVYPHVKDFFNNSIGLIDGLSEKVQPLADAFGKWLGGALTKAKEFFETFKSSDSARESMERVKEIFRTLSRVVEKLTGPVKEIADSLGEAAKAVGFSMWEIFLSVAETLAEVLEDYLVPAVRSVAEWMRENQDIVTLLVGVWTGYKVVMAGVTLATNVFKIAQAALNLVMAANPIGLVVTAIAALVAGLVWAYNNVDWFRDMVDTAWSWIQEKVGAVVDWFQENVWPKLQLVLDAVGEAMRQLWENVVQPVWSWIQEHVGKFVDWFSENVAPILAEVFEKLVALHEWWLNTVVAVWSWIFENVGPLVVWAFEKISEAAQNTWKIVKVAWDLIYAAIEPVASWIWDKVGPWIEETNRHIAFTFKYFGALVQLVWAQVWAAIEPVVSWFQNTVAPNVKAGIDSMVDGFKALNEFISAVWGWITSTISSAIGQIEKTLGAIKGAIDAVIGFFQDLYNGVVDKVGEVVSFVGELPGKILGALGDVGSMLYDAGVSIITGLWDGIKSRVGDLLDYVGGIAGQIRDFFPFSPAKRGPLKKKPMDKAGKTLMRMLAAGINKGANGPKKAAKEVAAAIAKQFGTKKNAKAMEKAARKAMLPFTKQMSKLTTKRNTVNDALKDAKAQVKELRQARKDFEASIIEGINQSMDLTQLKKGEGKMGWKDYLAEQKKAFDKQVKFQKYVNKLRKMGLNEEQLSNILAAGVDGGGFETAKSIAAGGKKAVKQFNKQQKQIDKSAKRFAQQMGKHFEQPGIEAAKGIVKGLQKQRAALDKEMERLGRRMVKTIKKELKIKSPSGVFWNEVGRPSGQGVIGGTVEAIREGQSEISRQFARTPMSLGDAVWSVEDDEAFRVEAAAQAVVGALRGVPLVAEVEYTEVARAARRGGHVLDRRA